MSAFSRWANKLAHDKLAMDKVDDEARGKLVELCALLAARFPDVTCVVHPIHTRKDVCRAAMDLGFDLVAVKSASRYKRGKPLIGRGLLDAWFEQRRRDIKTKLATEGISLSVLYTKPEERKDDSSRDG